MNATSHWPALASLERWSTNFEDGAWRDPRFTLQDWQFDEPQADFYTAEESRVAEHLAGEKKKGPTNVGRWTAGKL